MSFVGPRRKHAVSWQIGGKVFEGTCVSHPQAAGVPARLLPVPVWALQAGATLLGKGDEGLRRAVGGQPVHSLIDIIRLMAVSLSRLTPRRSTCKQHHLNQPVWS